MSFCRRIEMITRNFCSKMRSEHQLKKDAPSQVSPNQTSSSRTKNLNPMTWGGPCRRRTTSSSSKDRMTRSLRASLKRCFRNQVRRVCTSWDLMWMGKGWWMLTWWRRRSSRGRGGGISSRLSLRRIERMMKRMRRIMRIRRFRYSSWRNMMRLERIFDTYLKQNWKTLKKNEFLHCPWSDQIRDPTHAFTMLNLQIKVSMRKKLSRRRGFEIRWQSLK